MYLETSGYGVIRSVSSVADEVLSMSKLVLRVCLDSHCLLTLFFFNVTLAGLVSDAFHLTFGCGLLTFSLFAMATSRKKPDHAYSYGLEYF